MSIIAHIIHKVNTFYTFFMEINELLPLESNFTEVLASIALVPKMLYYYGKMPVLNEICTKYEHDRPTSNSPRRQRAVAIVGARKCTSYGREIAYQAAFQMAKAGLIVISGLAYGIDSVAHRAALDAGGTTVAILGTPIDQIYPRAHQGLAEEIVAKGGAVMSEYAPGQALLYQTSFLERNRLISGLSDGVLVVEAAKKSGTLNTAAHALEQGRELWAVPGNLGNINSEGCNRLIQQGAQPYIEPTDILNRIFPEYLQKKPTGPPMAGENPTEAAILMAIYTGKKDGEEIMASTGISASEFNVAITLLEIRGLVRSMGANQWSLGVQ